MEPMNVFLTTHRHEFKVYVDEICSISADHRTSTIPPSYATPITVLGRLPGTSREGFPSLPYLIDQARECAALVDVWLDTRQELGPNSPVSDELRRFDQLCQELRDKAKRSLTRAEQAERPSGTLEPKWEELVEQMQRKARFREAIEDSSPNTPTAEGSVPTENSSTSSLADSYFPRVAPVRVSPGASRLAFASSPRSPRSPGDENEEGEEESRSETETPPGSSSGVWDPGVVPSERLRLIPMENDETDSGIVDDEGDSFGSSIYSLTPTIHTSKHTGAHAKPLITPSYNRRHAGPRSTYSLRRSSDRADISKTVGPRNSNSREGPDSKEAAGRSIYRLNASSTASQPNIDTVPTPRTPGSRDGAGSKLRLGDFGGVFRKKVKERETEEGKGR